MLNGDITDELVSASLMGGAMEKTTDSLTDT